MLRFGVKPTASMFEGHAVRLTTAASNRSILNPRGKGLSGGEKQHICIARLLLRNSPLMVVDEPWSDLGFEARAVLAKVINRLKRNTTLLILTHEHLPELSVDHSYHLDPQLGAFRLDRP